MDDEDKRFNIDQYTEILKQYIPFDDIINFFLEIQNENQFWDKINLLPVTISFECRKLASKIKIVSSNFPNSFCEPTIEYFAASINPLSNFNEKIENVYTPTYISFIDIDWNEFNLKKEDFIYNEKSLINLACDSYIQNLHPWMFCPIDDVRIFYMSIFKLCELIEDKIIKNQVICYMRSFKITNKMDLSTLIPEVDISNIPDLFVEPTLQRFYSVLFDKASDLELQQVIPTRQSNDWEKIIAEALQDQMKYDLSQRATYSLTNPSVMTRLGLETEEGFDRFSLAEMIFTNGPNKTLPLPYTDLRVDIENKSKERYIKEYTHRYIAYYLYDEAEFDISSSHALNILTDFLTEEINKIASYSRFLSDKTGINHNECVLRALNIRFN